MTLNIKLTNRKALQSQLSAFVDQMVIPPSLALAIDEAPVDEVRLGWRRRVLRFASAVRRRRRGGGTCRGAP